MDASSPTTVAGATSDAGRAVREPIRILSEAPLEQVWTHLALWESKVLAARLLTERAQSGSQKVEPSKIDAKARGLAYCLRNAREQIRATQSSWISRVVSDYYGCMWLLSGVMIADPASKYDLETLEQRTKLGHGLHNVTDDALAFPRGEYVYMRPSGFFVSYLKHVGHPHAELELHRPESLSARTYEEFPESDRSHLVPLSQLLASIAELRDLFVQVTNDRPRTFPVWPSFNRQGLERSSAGASVTWICVGNAADMTADEVLATGLPLSELRFEASSVGGRKSWQGKLVHPDGKHWQDALCVHRSSMSASSWISPVGGFIRDVPAIHFMLLYALSILARYRPSRWREVLEGDLDHYKALFHAYLEVFERVVPQIVLERISGREVDVAQPGSINAPI